MLHSIYTIPTGEIEFFMGVATLLLDFVPIIAILYWLKMGGRGRHRKWIRNREQIWDKLRHEIKLIKPKSVWKCVSCDTDKGVGSYAIDSGQQKDSWGIGLNTLSCYACWDNVIIKTEKTLGLWWWYLITSFPSFSATMVVEGNVFKKRRMDLEKIKELRVKDKSKYESAEMIGVLSI